MAHDCRIYRNPVMVRNGLWVFTWIEFYNLTTTATLEIMAYDASGNNMGGVFSITSNNLQSATSSAIYNGDGTVTYRQIGINWEFLNATVAAQAVTIHLWCYAEGLCWDYY